MQKWLRTEFRTKLDLDESVTPFITPPSLLADDTHRRRRIRGVPVPTRRTGYTSGRRDIHPRNGALTPADRSSPRAAWMVHWWSVQATGLPAVWSGRGRILFPGGFLPNPKRGRGSFPEGSVVLRASRSCGLGPRSTSFGEYQNPMPRPLHGLLICWFSFGVEWQGPTRKHEEAKEDRDNPFLRANDRNNWLLELTGVLDGPSRPAPPLDGVALSRPLTARYATVSSWSERQVVGWTFTPFDPCTRLSSYLVSNEHCLDGPSDLQECSRWIGSWVHYL